MINCCFSSFYYLGIFMKRFYTLSFGILVSSNLHGMWVLQSACKLVTSYINRTPPQTTTFNQLPPAAVAHISTFMPKHDIRNLRLVNHLCATVPAPRGLCNPCEHARCEKNAMLEYLRHCRPHDTWLYYSHDEFNESTVISPVGRSHFIDELQQAIEEDKWQP